MKQMLNILYSYRRGFLLICLVGVVVFYVYRAMNIIFSADFSAEDVESQTEEYISLILEQIE